MGSIGPAEILLVLVVALVVLGPKRLPDAARSMGKAFAEMRRFASGFQSEVRDAFSEPAPSYPAAPSDVGPQQPAVGSETGPSAASPAASPASSPPASGDGQPSPAASAASSPPAAGDTATRQQNGDSGESSVS